MAPPSKKGGRRPPGRRRGGPREAGPWSGRGRGGRPRRDGPRPGGQRPEGQRPEGQRPEGQRPEGRRPEGRRPGGRPVPPREAAAEPSRRPPASVLAGLDILEVEIEKLVAGGEGLARVEGIPIFVARSAPGDRLRVRLTGRHPDFGRAEIVEVLEPGPGRREPACPFFARCGGCDLQHLEDDLQLRLKAEAVRETLLRLGGIEMPPQVTVVPGPPWGYRLRTQLHVQRTGEGYAVGYFARGSNRLVPVDRCPVLVPELEAWLPRLPAVFAAQPKRRLDLAAGDGGQVTSAPVLDALPHGPVSSRIGEFEYEYDARVFFQGHRQLLAQLVEHVVGDHEGEEAIDLYAGVGLFSLPLARRYRRVIAVEGDIIAARFARNNGRKHNLSHLTVEGLSIEAWVHEQPLDRRAPTRVVLDPPRTGLSGKVRSWLIRHRPERLTYASCHPAALARDLKRLHFAYHLDSIALLDLFPQTGHIEVVAQLSVRERPTEEPGDGRRRETAPGRRAAVGEGSGEGS